MTSTKFFILLSIFTTNLYAKDGDYREINKGKFGHENCRVTLDLSANLNHSVDASEDLELKLKKLISTKLASQGLIVSDEQSEINAKIDLNIGIEDQGKQKEGFITRLLTKGEDALVDYTVLGCEVNTFDVNLTTSQSKITLQSGRSKRSQKIIKNEKKSTGALKACDIALNQLATKLVGCQIYKK